VECTVVSAADAMRTPTVIQGEVPRAVAVGFDCLA